MPSEREISGENKPLEREDLSSAQSNVGRHGALLVAPAVQIAQ